MRSGAQKTIPVVDIFAGPGGLSEGFSRYSPWSDGYIDFRVRLSIEKDATAAETLRLRSYFREFSEGGVPETYYSYLRGTGEHPAQTDSDRWESACAHVWNVELGRICERDLHRRISEVLNGTDNWVLLGGPPCQAYSLAGRSRMTGLGVAGRAGTLSASALELEREKRLEKFFADARHTLYREYLRIVAVHQPAVFVMENVKGILSSKIRLNGNIGAAESERVFPQIREDLSDPWGALADDPRHHELAGYRRHPPRKYKLHSFVCGGSADGTALEDRNFLIRSENYGVPQKRHRVIILGVREDVDKVPVTLTATPINAVTAVLGNMPKLRSGLSREPDSAGAWQSALKSCFTDDLLDELNDFGVRADLSRVLGRNTVHLDRGGQFVKSAAPVKDVTGALSRWIEDEHLGGIIQHETRGHMRSDLSRYLFAAAAARELGRTPKLDQWPAELLPAHRNVHIEEGSNRASADGFLDRFRVQSWDQPASTVTSHIAKDG